MVVAEKGRKLVIKSYKGATNYRGEFTFGMTSEQLADVDKTVYWLLSDAAKSWKQERRGGYSTELVNGKLVALLFRASEWLATEKQMERVSVEIDGIEYSDINDLKEKFEHFLYANGESILFPALGVLYSVTPLRDGWEAPRPGVFNEEIIAFSKDRLEHYRNASQVLTVQPFDGVNISGGNHIKFGMTQTQVELQWGKPELVWDELNGSHNYLVEYRYDRGLKLFYKDINGNVQLESVDVIERDGWQVEVSGIRLFQDANLEQMKSKYQHIDSKKGKATAFPELGILAVGCGAKKNNGKGADGKYVKSLLQERFDSYTEFIAIFD